MYGSLQLHGDEVACPTSSGTASGFTDNNPDETLNIRFSNYGSSDATIHYLNSGGVQIGSMTLRAGSDILIHKRRAAELLICIVPCKMHVLLINCEMLTVR